MSEVIKVAMAALRKAEVEMRYAGWSVFQSDNIGRFDAMKQVLDAIHFLRNCEGQMKDEVLPSNRFDYCVATPNQAMNMASVGKQQYPAAQSGQLTGDFGWYKSGESKDYDPKGLHITHTPVPQTATDCTRIMREQGKPYPRTCPRCGLGPCAYSPMITVAEPQGEPVAWGMLSKGVIVDAICPAEHDEEEGDYTVALFTHGMRDLSDEEIDKAWRSVDYTVPYDQFRIDVARAIIAAAREKA